jgi:zinc transport system substrate-binding protein
MRLIYFLFLTLSLAIAKDVIAVSIPPEKLIVERLSDFDAISMVEVGSSPHTYEPKPSQMVKISKAKGYFKIGVEFENIWLDKFKNQNPAMKIFEADKNITKIPMSIKGGKPDPHIWLDPINLKEIAKNIAKGLIEIDPKNREIYQKRLKLLLADLTQLDRSIKENLKGIKSRNFLALHPSWGYFAKRYNLSQLTVEVEGKEPSIREFISLLKDAKQKGVRIIFTQPEFSKKQAEIVARELGIKLVPISPMEKDFFKNLLFFSQEIAKANR